MDSWVTWCVNNPLKLIISTKWKQTWMFLLGNSSALFADLLACTSKTRANQMYAESGLTLLWDLCGVFDNNPCHCCDCRALIHLQTVCLWTLTAWWSGLWCFMNTVHSPFALMLQLLSSFFFLSIYIMLAVLVMLYFALKVAGSLIYVSICAIPLFMFKLMLFIWYCLSFVLLLVQSHQATHASYF